MMTQLEILLMTQPCGGVLQGMDMKRALRLRNCKWQTRERANRDVLKLIG
jgi:hypothetical protein